MDVKQCTKRYPHGSHWHKVTHGELQSIQKPNEHLSAMMKLLIKWQSQIVLCPGIDKEMQEDTRREEKDAR